MKNKKTQKKLRHIRVKKSLENKNINLRLIVFRSNKHIYAQIVDDKNARTLIAHSDLKIGKDKKMNSLLKAKEVGLNLAKNSAKKNIKKIVFDRAGYKYHGRIKALAEGAREGGLIF